MPKTPTSSESCRYSDLVEGRFYQFTEIEKLDGEESEMIQSFAGQLIKLEGFGRVSVVPIVPRGRIVGIRTGVRVKFFNVREISRETAYEMSVSNS